MKRIVENIFIVISICGFVTHLYWYINVSLRAMFQGKFEKHLKYLEWASSKTAIRLLNWSFIVIFLTQDYINVFPAFLRYIYIPYVAVFILNLIITIVVKYINNLYSVKSEKTL